MIVLFYFSDMAEKISKIANSFRKTSYESKLSKTVKCIDKWIVDPLKYEKRKNRKEKGKAFLNNDVAQWNLWHFKKINEKWKIAFSSSKSRKKTHLPWQLWAKVLVSFDFQFICRPSPQLLTFVMILAECK